MDKFPSGPPEAPEYLTEIPARGYSSGGTYKFHKHLGYAKNAITAFSRSGGKIYKWDGDAWELLFDVPPGTRYDEMPWK